ncbi:5-dehydro-4-deoxy-D-glucuronate isomerase [Devosia sp. J2-20]|jgi:4-deoxy-L-threo-5-hexosulose-uronate ketol-isomerase|uniref:4-deoxy-L-threo-5-hexosulose-uronate ketol-isomerase n=1 Tax=Devosia litorisediminis TaxID=2829817 RepID=A0A942I4I2_9HYPH|nr:MULTISPECIES: 5-dehydro-4-deoxy-D-glucuronate isomerase [Devosia]MBS3847356.1 5-dehydro-4-deoxy-D-glucuronate isomerase [Devosia litorisediminis]MCZ4346728.1 5-dehydro-4-deoxy-D-glucuronate isomerase [Devosia neptuniae]WDQ99516.1 5-dehydro-4-deoxy-D-glucuronate isomerase [Devosia sp. J2-20]|tara:strand:- start:1678 stop:2520 length:843 start_codon:yes stop_codon:yes gene_type:complete
MSTDFDIRFAIDPVSASTMNTEELRENFLIDDLFSLGNVNWTYTHYDRMAVGSAMPGGSALQLEVIKPTGTANFLDRREMIAANIGGAGSITVDGVEHAVGTKDMLYVGMGNKDVRFASNSADAPAKFYLVSAPAHVSHPTKLIRQGDAKRIDLGSKEAANERSIFQFVNADSVKTCQLVVGLTSFAPGSVWNTMPAHVHDRRMEAYLYFELDPDAVVVHLMGEPDETRHLMVRNEQAIISPPWSIHSGAGTGSYTFIWAMAGDNIDYTDVEKVGMDELL